MVILGIDPGTASMGYGVLNVFQKRPILKDSNVIRTFVEMDMHKRLAVLYSNLDDVAKTYKPDLVVIESLFFNTNTKTAISVGQARGISMLVAAHNNIAIAEYTALQAKKALTGYGRSSKKEMQQAVMEILGLSSQVKSDDANDGIAMALCHYMITEGIAK